jgi:hypothetical protein
MTKRRSVALELLQLVRWDKSYDLEFFSTEVATAELKSIAHVPPNFLYKQADEQSNRHGEVHRCIF